MRVASIRGDTPVCLDRLKHARCIALYHVVPCGNGACVTGLCECYTGFYSSDGYNNPGSKSDCGAALDPVASCPGRPLECSGHGKCNDYPEYQCACDVGWTGGDCSERTCSSLHRRRGVAKRFGTKLFVDGHVIVLTKLCSVALQASARRVTPGSTRRRGPTTWPTSPRSAPTRAFATGRTGSATASAAGLAMPASEVRTPGATRLCSLVTCRTALCATGCDVCALLLLSLLPCVLLFLVGQCGARSSTRSTSAAPTASACPWRRWRRRPT